MHENLYFVSNETFETEVGVAATDTKSCTGQNNVKIMGSNSMPQVKRRIQRPRKGCRYNSLDLDHSNWYDIVPYQITVSNISGVTANVITLITEDTRFRN